MRRFFLVASVLAAAFGFSASTASAGILDVTLAGSGTGTVTSSPAGIDCSNVPGSTQTACIHDYGFLFSTGTLTATPGEGSAFVSWAGTAGGTCVGTANPCETQILLLGGSVTATFAPKPDPPSVMTGGASGIAFPSATVVGTVNPNSDDFQVSACYFEFGLTTDYGERAACRPASVGTGTSPVAVSASIGVLDPEKTYHYRLVAKNGGGTTLGEDQTLRSGVAPADNCPNAAVRAQQGALAQRLPNCGAYELVSPPFTSGQSAAASVGAAAGDSVMLASVGGFAGTENLPDLGIQYVTEREESGWMTSAIAPPASRFPYTLGALDWTRDGRQSLWFVNLKADEGTNRFTPVVRDPNGSFHVAGPTQEDKSIPGAASDGLRTVVQRTASRPALTDGTTDTRDSSVNSLYASTRDASGSLSVSQVAYRGGDTMFPTCGVELGGVAAGGSSVDARNALSNDGRRIFFTAVGQGACGGPAARRVWAKVDGQDPVDLSASQCLAICGPEAAANYRAASRDGSRVYFTTEQRLLLDDQDTSGRNDLYEYDFNAPPGSELRLVTGSSDPAGADVVAATAAGLVRTSNDGAYVYFIATGRPLTGPNDRGVAPQSGGNNLYVYHRAEGQANGTTTFIGALASVNDSSAQVSSTGRYFLFQTTADLTSERGPGDTRIDLYRYDADEDELLRVWTDDSAHNGAARTDGATVAGGAHAAGGIPSGASYRGSAGGWFGGQQLSDDGSLVGFTTAEPLSRDDRNTAEDAYLWEAGNGRVTMLTDGTSNPGNRYSGAGSRFTGMTPSGDSLFIVSASPLLRAHTSGQNATYVVRRNGGFPAAPDPPVPCNGDECQGPSPTPIPLGGSDGSSKFGGPGNVLLDRPGRTATVKVSKAKSVRGSATRVEVRVSGKGKIQVSGTNLVRTALTASKAGTYRVSVKLGKKARSTLERKRRIKVRASIRFTPEKGKSVIARVSVTFASKASKRASTRLTREPGVPSSAVQKGR